MVELKFTGMCEGCGFADLELINAGTLRKRDYVVLCSHEPVCRRYNYELKAEKERSNEKGRS